MEFAAVQRSEGFGAVDDGFCFVSKLVELREGYEPIGGIVLCEEDAYPSSGRCGSADVLNDLPNALYRTIPLCDSSRFLRGMKCRSGGFQRQDEPEAGSFSFLALDAYGSAHQFDELFGDGQPETGASVFASGRY